MLLLAVLQQQEDQEEGRKNGWMDGKEGKTTTMMIIKLLYSTLLRVIDTFRQRSKDESLFLRALHRGLVTRCAFPCVLFCKW